MYIYVTSKNTGPSWQSDPLHVVYMGVSVKEAEDAVGEFSRYQKPLPSDQQRPFYSALPKTLDKEMIQFYMADGWWYSIERIDFQIAD